MRRDGVLRIAVAGMGGYAAHIQDLILRVSSHGSPVKLEAVCDPRPGRFPHRVTMMREHHVEVFDDYAFMIARDVDAVWLPVPIHLHRPFTERALAMGLPVMCEKPPVGCVDDLDAMAHAATLHGRPLMFGYQDIYDPTTPVLKKMLLDGVIGEIERASVAACWPRDSAYFRRNDWAGKLRSGTTWVLDSILNNALAHPVNQALFLLGASAETSAKPVAVTAETYRVNDIENFDTISCRIRLARGAELVIAMTHACRQNHEPVITLHGTRGRAVITCADIGIESIDGFSRKLERGPKHEMMLETLMRVVCGEPAPGAVADVSNVRPHLEVVNAVAQCCVVHDVDQAFVDSIPVAATPEKRQAVLRAIRGIEADVFRAAEQCKLFSELGTVFATEASSAQIPAEFHHFTGPAAPARNLMTA